MFTKLGFLTAHSRPTT